MIKNVSVLKSLSAVIVAIACPSLVCGMGNVVQQEQAFSYNYTEEAALAERFDLDNPDPDMLRETFSRRRQRVIQSIPEGAMLIHSVEWVQPRRLEFQVPHSDNHDFIFLTGLEGLQSVGSALLLVPTPEKDWIVLFTSSDIEFVRKITGIEDVRDYQELEKELSVAMTDYRDWRITQIRRWPLAAALSRAWGRNHKTLYLNYPRFFRLGMPEPPRLKLFKQFERFSPEMELRDGADILDPVRMLHDGYGLANLRRAVNITGEGIVEALSIAKVGISEREVMETMDFVYRYRGADLGFPTAVRRAPMTGRVRTHRIPEGFIQYVPRSGQDVFQPDDMLHTDTGAEFNHYSADIQRNIPINGTFNDEQRRLYEIALDVQKTVISQVRPGVTWRELHDLAVTMLKEAGGYDKYYTYGIGHFIGMEVHDEGDYQIPMKPGMALSIEQGVAPPDGPRIAFEDDVLVTQDGYEWLSEWIPIEINDVEELAKRRGKLEEFVAR